jgi:transposase
MTHVGIDAHKNWLYWAMLTPDSDKAVTWETPNTAEAVRRMVRKLMREAVGEVRCCYEAGPCGYALQRQLAKEGIACVVVAPSMIPQKPGDRVKTDRRDARKLAELDRAGLLTEVRPPSPEEEAVRDLSRCREDAKQDEVRCRHRLGKMLLRRGLIWREGKAWTQKHRRWLKGLRFEQSADQAVLDQYLLALEQAEERVKVMEERLEQTARQEPYREPVGWLRCFRGIDTITAITVMAELHDFRRFRTPRELMGYLGFGVSEDTSGDTTRRMGITKAGNGHVRRVLVEASWHYRHRPLTSAMLRQRRKGQPARVIAIAEKAQQRLNRRYLRLTDKGKNPNVAVTAVARELTGCLWAALNPEPRRSVAVKEPMTIPA